MDIFIDEGWRLLRSGAFADLLDELGRRARKRGIGVSLVTHLPGDLAKNQTSLSMASTAFIGRMGPDDAQVFFRSLGVSDGEAAANAKRVAQLPPHVFLAAPAGGRREELIQKAAKADKKTAQAQGEDPTSVTRPDGGIPKEKKREKPIDGHETSLGR